MELLADKPVERIVSEMKKSPVAELKIACPFITSAGLTKELIPFLKTRHTKVSLLTNLHPLCVALSLSNPIEPLLQLLSELPTRVVIRSNPLLHAKVLLADSRCGMTGSSNITLGGFEKNVEINWLLENRKQDRAFIQTLNEWFDGQWKESGPNMSKSALEVIQQKWDADSKRRGAFIGNVKPNPRLGGDYWKKVMELMKQEKWKRKTMDMRLWEQDKEKAKPPKNSTGKLLFLQDIGVVNSFDETSVQINKKAAVQMNKPAVVLKKLVPHLPGIYDVFKGIAISKGLGYEKLGEMFNVPNDDEQLRVSVLWLESLEYITRETGETGKDIFLITKEGRKIANRV